jgi:heptosyltransferase-2
MTTLRTVVVGTNWVGDTIMSLPVLDALAASGREVTVLAKRSLHSLLRLAPTVGSVLERGETRATVELLRAGGFDEALILPNSFRSAWMTQRAGIPYRWGYEGGARSLLLRPAVPRPRPAPRRPQIEDYAELLAALGVAAPASWVPRLDLPAPIRAAGAERLARGRIDLGRPRRSRVVGLFAGAEFGPSKRWPWQRFAELARTLRREEPSTQFVILAGPARDELWSAVRIHEESGKLHPVIGPDLDLSGLAGVLSHLDLLVTNDSGPMHLAAALGISLVAVFGSTDWRETAPFGARATVVRESVHCAPCGLRECPIDHRCMRRVTVDRVLAPALELFS